jgi:hypothetical protein
MDRHPLSALGNEPATNVTKGLPEPEEWRLLFLAKNLLFCANDFPPREGRLLRQVECGACGGEPADTIVLAFEDAIETLTVTEQADTALLLSRHLHVDLAQDRWNRMACRFDDPSASSLTNAYPPSSCADYRRRTSNLEHFHYWRRYPEFAR